MIKLAMVVSAKNISLPEKIILWLIIISILLLSFLVIRPILMPLIYGTFLAYIFYPVYTGLLKNKKILLSAKTAALTVLLLILAIIVFPVLMIVTIISVNREIIFKFFNGFFLELNLNHAKYLSFFNQDFIKNLGLKINFGEMFTRVSAEILRFIQVIITQTPQFLLNSFVALIVVYYVLRKADQILPFLSRIIPLQKKQFGLIIKRFDGFAHGLLASQFAIALVQAVLMFIALLILGNKYTLLLTLLTFILALIPFLGAITVWGILTIYLFANVASGVPLWQPIFMLLYGSLLVSMVDNFIRPKILAETTKINPAVVLIGLIGGFIAFGLPGIFVGPVVLTLLDLAFDLYKQLI